MEFNTNGNRGIRGDFWAIRSDWGRNTHEMNHLTFWRRNYYFFLILAQPVYKM